MHCSNCNQNLPDDSTFCNKCGHKVSESDFEISSTIENDALIVNNTFNKPTLNKKSKRKPFILSLVILLIFAAAGGGYWYYVDKQQKEEAAAEAAVKQYQDNLSEAVLRIVAYSYISEEITNVYSNVWSEAIDADFSIEVNGKSAYNFNEAIQYQREAFEEKGLLKNVKDNTQAVDTLMKKLNNPPQEFQKAYNTLVELYGYYIQYTDQVDSPTGSLIEFNRNKNELSSEISKGYNQFKILLPNLDESKITEYIGSQSI